MAQQDDKSAVTLEMSQETLSAVVADRYTRDEEFRGAFNEDPKAAISQWCEHDLPSDVEVVVHRNEIGRWHVALPALDLSDRELEGVSAGASWIRTEDGRVYWTRTTSPRPP